jgi:HD-like signal output (HDOD) protein
MLRFLARKNKDPKRELQKILGTYALPSFPAAILRTLEAIREPEATPSSIGAALSADPGLSVRILGTVNSAAYALRREVRSLDHAVALLGIPAVESVVLSVGVGDSLPSDSAPGYESARFWRAAARRAAVAKVLAARLHPARASESFTAALLQDMAVPFLATKQTEVYGPVLEEWHSGGDDLAVLEQERFGWNHPEVATWLCNEWGLPESLAAAIGGHHGVLNEGNEGLDCPPAVFLVSYLREMDDHLGTDELAEVAEERFQLPVADAHQLIDASLENAESLVAQFA